MKEQLQSRLEAQPPITRKGFLTLTGKYAAIGAMSGLAIQSTSRAFAQAPLKAASPPARVPAKPERSYRFGEMEIGI